MCSVSLTDLLFQLKFEMMAWDMVTNTVVGGSNSTKDGYHSLSRLPALYHVLHVIPCDIHKLLSLLQMMKEVEKDF